MHHQRVHSAERRVQENAGQTPDNRESKALPQPDRALVAADYEVELHGAEPERLRVLERMQTHGTRDTASAGPRRGHVAAVGNVRASAFVIRL